MQISKLKLGIVLALILLLGSVGVAKSASSWDWGWIKERVAEKIADKIDSPESLSEVKLGAAVGSELPNPHCEAGECTWVVIQTWQSRTNTLTSIMDPFQSVTGTAGGVVLKTLGSENYTGLSTTVDMVRVYQTNGATSSFNLGCAPSVGAFAKGQIETAKYIVTTTGSGLATSTIGVLENNMTGAQGNRVDGGTIAKVMLGPQDPYFVCLADPLADSATLFTNGDSTTTGKTVVRFRRTR